MRRTLLLFAWLLLPGFCIAGPLSRTAIPAGMAPGGPGLPADGLRSWPQSTREIIATPIFCDVDGDDQVEVLVGDDRYFYVWSLDGTLQPGWPREIGGTQQHAAAADIDGDGFVEICVTSNLPTPKLQVFDSAGNSKPGWPVAIPYTQLANLTCPVIVDLDGDGHLDVGTAGENGVFFYDAEGAPLAGWPYQWGVPINNPQWSAPAVGDVDEDGHLEVAVGNVCYPSWGVYLLRDDGTVAPGWPQIIKPVYSSPALADLDGDGDLEIIAQEGDPGSQGYRLWVWHHDGTTMAGWPRNVATEGNSSRSNPAIADVQNDGVLEIVTVTADGKLHIFLPGGDEMAGYPKNTGAVQPIASVSVLDVNDDGIQEIFLTYWLSSQQWLSGWTIDGAVLPGFPKSLYNPSDLNSHSSTHIGDVDGDGTYEIAVAGSGMTGSGRVYVFDVDNSIASPTARADWPKIRRDVENHGCYCGANPAAIADFGAIPAGIAIAPNPARRDARILLRGGAGIEGRIEIIDPSGRILASRFVSGRGESSLRSLLGGRCSRGIYWVRWVAAGGAGTHSARLLLLEGAD